jgi:hypothetical protein
VSLAYDDVASSVDVVEFNLNVLNEHLLEKIKCKAQLLKSNEENNGEKYNLVVDTSELFAVRTTTTSAAVTAASAASSHEIDSNEIDLSCTIELKYTNQLGIEHNLCHAFKKQFTLRFGQTALASLKSINELR